MTLREYKNAGGTWDREEFANDAGSFGHKGSIIYGYCPGMLDWELAGIHWTESGSKVVRLVYPYTAGNAQKD